MLSTKNKINVFLVEDHPIFRKGLAQLINNEKDMSICGEAEDTLIAMKSIKESKPDIAIVDITLKDRSGIDLIKDARLQFPKMPIIVLSMHDEKIYAERSLRAGAKGYIMKQEAPEIIIKAIRHVLNGNIYVSDQIATRIFSLLLDGKPAPDSSPVDLLTDRELEVFELIGQGFGTRQVAQKLNISIKTVENHRIHIKEKLNIENAIELVQKATLWVQSEQQA
jgi:DNA-binding NarL/FixJ family response regulator